MSIFIRFRKQTNKQTTRTRTNQRNKQRNNDETIFHLSTASGKLPGE
jgi:hypothetical protein